MPELSTKVLRVVGLGGWSWFRHADRVDAALTRADALLTLSGEESRAQSSWNHSGSQTSTAVGEGAHVADETEHTDVIGRTAYDSNGDLIGRVGHVFMDDNTGRPEFATVDTGLFGTAETFVPIVNATVDAGRLTVPFTRDQVRAAPNVEVENGHLDQSEEARLYQHYGMSYAERPSDFGPPSEYEDDTHRANTTNLYGTEGHSTAGPTTYDAMSRSEERLDVSTPTHQAGGARLRKYVTPETETATVPVTEERLVIETEPITDRNLDDALDGPTISEEEHELVLTEERHVLENTATPVERVRLGTETVTEQETITEEVRKEHIEAESDVTDRRGNS